MTEDRPQAGRWPRVFRRLLGAELVLIAGLTFYVGCHVYRDVFSGSPPPLPAQLATGACMGDDAASPCRASFVELNPGRYRVTTDGPARRLTLTVGGGSQVAAAQVVLAKLVLPRALRIEVAAGAVAVAVQPLASDVRTLVELPPSAAPVSALTFVQDGDVASSPIVLDEVGLFTSNRGLMADVRPIFAWIPPKSFYGTLLPRAVGRLCLFTLVAALLLPAAALRKANPVAVAGVAFGLCLLDLAILFSPYWMQDLRAFYAAGPLQDPPGANLNTGLWQGFRLMHGGGLTFGPGQVPWERMPGYGLFCGLAGTLFGGRTLLDLAISTVRLQVLFYVAALALLMWTGRRLLAPAAAWALGVLLALLPKELAYTQVDAVIGSAMLLILAALCVRLDASRDRDPVPWRIDVVVHLAFAGWLLLRPDVLPGWAIVSIALHRRQWRRLLIPIILFLVIGSAWGGYRARYTHQFTMTTSSAGAALFCGLFEVPSRFKLACSDQSYFDWIRAHTTLDPTTPAANSFAQREVIRFWIMYPGHLVFILYEKMLRFVDGDMWPGFPTALQISLFQTVPRSTLALFFLTVIALCIVVGHERARTLLFGWPVFLDAPLFWVMFASEGRFYHAAGIAVLAAAVPPIFESKFYAALTARPWRTAAVLACSILFVLGRWPIHDWLTRADAFHYWTPLLDPGHVSLERVPMIDRGETVYETQWFKVLSVAQDGADPYYMLELPDYVTIVAVTPERQLLLVRQYRPVVGRQTLELPSGHVDHGESPEQAARRELLEETGYEAPRLELLGTLVPDVGRLANRMWCYFAPDVTPSRSVVEREAGVSVHRYPEREALRLAGDGTLDHALHLAVLFLAVSSGWLTMAPAPRPDLPHP